MVAVMNACSGDVSDEENGAGDDLYVGHERLEENEELRLHILGLESFWTQQLYFHIGILWHLFRNVSFFDSYLPKENDASLEPGTSIRTMQRLLQSYQPDIWLRGRSKCSGAKWCKTRILLL